MATIFDLTSKALGLAYNILSFIKEDKAAGIVDIVRKFVDDLSKTDFKGIE